MVIASVIAGPIAFPQPQPQPGPTATAQCFSCGFGGFNPYYRDYPYYGGRRHHHRHHHRHHSHGYY